VAPGHGQCGHHHAVVRKRCGISMSEPYGFRDYLALAMHCLRRRMTSAQLVDYCYQKAGIDPYE
jgi:hypothetical protein